MRYLSLDLKKKIKKESFVRIPVNLFPISKIQEALGLTCCPVLPKRFVRTVALGWRCLLLPPGRTEKQHLWLLPLSPAGLGSAVMEGDAAPLLLAHGASLRKGHLTPCPPRTSSPANKLKLKTRICEPEDHSRNDFRREALKIL